MTVDFSRCNTISLVTLCGGEQSVRLRNGILFFCAPVQALGRTNGHDAVMGDIHHFPRTRNTETRLLEKLIDETISAHSDSRVAERWSGMAKKTFARYPGPPMPSQSMLDIDGIEGLDEEQRLCLLNALQQWLDSYFNDVNTQLLQVHGDLLVLQKRVAELEVEAAEKDN